MSGWLALHRGWRDCEAFEPRRDSMADEDAWLWMLEHTAWKPMRRTGGQGQVVSLERGQLHVSDRGLSTAFQWDKKRVRRFLERLEAHSMIRVHRDQSGTILSICNYDKYQQNQEASGPAKDQQRTTQEQGKQDSASNEAGVPPVDTVKAIWELGVTLLTASGQTDRAARSIVGRWRKDHTDARVLEALLDCQARRISNPVEWMPRRLAASASRQSEAGAGDLVAHILKRKAA
ncbi:hypothetical protein [Sphingomonas sp. NIC1]|uniref:hypothetical protein n=1 Tax=Sphingomonas sp. NIC1 TaxID=1961362 RepID=UPI0007C0DAAE|nr:hypothetical protein [Sphingomonas sp. NIC1]ANC85448.1 hypothetical protein A7E77_00175 [Sphingomonas sp. NIC1]